MTVYYQKGLKSQVTGFQKQAIDYCAIIYYYTMLSWAEEHLNVSEAAGKKQRKCSYFLQLQIKHAKIVPSKLEASQLFQGFWPPETVKTLP